MCIKYSYYNMELIRDKIWYAFFVLDKYLPNTTLYIESNDEYQFYKKYLSEYWHKLNQSHRKKNRKF